MSFEVPWFIYTIIFILIAISATIKAKINKQITWFWVLAINLLIGIVLASGASLPLSIIYLLFFNKPKK